MTVHIYLGDKKYELEDGYALNEPLVNQSFFLQEDGGERTRYTVVRVNNVLINSGNHLDVIK